MLFFFVLLVRRLNIFICVFFNFTDTTAFYTYCHTLSLHDALPISRRLGKASDPARRSPGGQTRGGQTPGSSARSFWRSTSIGTSLPRSEEHTSELQSLMRISYAVFCLKKKKKTHI